jgi:hypothetical protein
MAGAERELVDQLRKDARVDCRPRRTDLPWGALAGVECFIDSDLVSRVGVYSFGTAEALDGYSSDELSEEERRDGVAATHYFVNLSDYGVEAQSGDCRDGKPGDASWPDYLPDYGIGPHELSPWRWGCYHDEYDHANIRVTCYRGIYIGILGKTSDIRALTKWAWKAPEDQTDGRDPPGICEAGD